MKPDPSIRISVKNSANEGVKIRLYDAEHFGGPAGMYRLKVGREWLKPGEKYVFFSSASALDIAARCVGFEPAAAPPPALRYRDRVRVTVKDSEGNGIREQAFAASPPYQGPDGRWRVFVLTFKHGMVPFLCDEIEVL